MFNDEKKLFGAENVKLKPAVRAKGSIIAVNAKNSRVKWSLPWALKWDLTQSPDWKTAENGLKKNNLYICAGPNSDLRILLF